MAFFRDLLKKWFYTNSSSAASNDARIPLLTATGEPKGSDTMANIASVLGANSTRDGGKNLMIKGQFNSSSVDCNDFVTGIYHVYSAVLNMPVNGGDFLIQSFLEGANGDGFQLAMQVYDRTQSSANGVFYRIKVGSSWGDWVRIDNYGTTSLSSLANALGVMQNKDKPQEKDLNNIFDIGFYLIQIVDGTYINKPIGAGAYGALVVFECGNYTLQVWIDDAINSKMFIRGNWSHGNWYAWREITLTAQ